MPKNRQDGDPCPKCGRTLRNASLSGAFLECSRKHVYRVLCKCSEVGCRRRATQFISGRGGFCEDHGEITWVGLRSRF